MNSTDFHDLHIESEQFHVFNSFSGMENIPSPTPSEGDVEDQFERDAAERDAAERDTAERDADQLGVEVSIRDAFEFNEFRNISTPMGSDTEEQVENLDDTLIRNFERSFESDDMIVDETQSGRPEEYEKDEHIGSGNYEDVKNGDVEDEHVVDEDIEMASIRNQNVHSETHGTEEE